MPSLRVVKGMKVNSSEMNQMTKYKDIPILTKNNNKIVVIFQVKKIRL